MILPPVESTPLILLRFPSNVTTDLLNGIKKHLEANNFIILATEYEKSEEALKSLEAYSAVVLIITIPQSSIETQFARSENVMATVPEKTYRNQSILEQFTIENRSKFIPSYSGEEQNEKTSDCVPFSSGQRVAICFEILEDLNVLNVGEKHNELSQVLDNMGISYIHGDSSKQISRGNIFIDGSNISVDTSMNFLHVLKKNDLIESIAPVHSTALKEQILRNSWNLFTPLPVDQIRDYYGEEIAYYFSWLKFFTNWLTIPAIGGISVFFIRRYNGDTIQTCELTPFFGMGVFIWATLFIRFWEREESRLAYKYGTFRQQSFKRDFLVRPEFKGEIRTSPITGNPEMYYSPNLRRLKYVGSALITMAMLFVAFTIMIISLNLQGYVHPDHDANRWQETSHPFYYPVIAHLSEEGQLFDVNSPIMSFVPAILHAVTIMFLNSIYREIAEKTTKWENHRSYLNHENSLILKRFLFEAFDAYIALFYLTFYEMDVEKLRGEILMVFLIDTFRRMFLECIVPLVQRKLSERGAQSDRKKNDDWFDPGNLANNNHSQYLNESKLDEYEEFDDYLEMVVQFGYITLFASAIPLGAAIAVFANIVELRTDATKLARVLARPRPIMTDSIGIWLSLIRTIVILSALTNCFIVGLTSNQLMQFVPMLFFIGEDGEKHMIKGKGYIVILVIVGIERLLLIIHLLLNSLIPKVPEDVLENLARCEFVKNQEAKLLRFEETNKMKGEKDN